METTQIALGCKWINDQSGCQSLIDTDLRLPIRCLSIALLAISSYADLSVKSPVKLLATS